MTCEWWTWVLRIPWGRWGSPCAQDHFVMPVLAPTCTIIAQSLRPFVLEIHYSLRCIGYSCFSSKFWNSGIWSPSDTPLNKAVKDRSVLSTLNIHGILEMIWIFYDLKVIWTKDLGVWSVPLPPFYNTHRCVHITKTIFDLGLFLRIIMKVV